MKYNLLFLFLFNSGLTFSQNFTLTSNNPEPRMGQEFEVSGYLNDTLTEVRFNNILKIRNIARVEGLNLIGPLSININGNTYLSDTLTINVIEELDKTKEGIWVRYVNFQNKDYIILEQVINAKPRRESQNKVTFDNQDVTFAELDLSQFNSDEIKIWNPASNSSFGYKRWLYQYHKKEGYEPITLDKKYFKNLPKKAKIDKVVLK